MLCKAGHYTSSSYTLQVFNKLYLCSSHRDTLNVLISLEVDTMIKLEINSKNYPE